MDHPLVLKCVLNNGSVGYKFRALMTLLQILNLNQQTIISEQPICAIADVFPRLINNMPETEKQRILNSYDNFETQLCYLRDYIKSSINNWAGCCNYEDPVPNRVEIYIKDFGETPKDARPIRTYPDFPQQADPYFEYTFDEFFAKLDFNTNTLNHLGSGSLLRNFIMFGKANEIEEKVQILAKISAGSRATFYAENNQKPMSLDLLILYLGFPIDLIYYRIVD